jgi:hypothetical protein
MNYLDKNGIGIEIKKGWLKIEGDNYHVDEGGIELYSILNDISGVSPKEQVEFIFPHTITTSGRFMVCFSYHPDLLLRGWISGPTFSIDGVIKPRFKFKAEKAVDLSTLPWLVRLLVFKL